MTEQLYYADAYLREFEARVTAAADDAVVLDRSAFYPGGGGQPADRGTLEAEGRRWEVIGLRRADGQVWHVLAEADDSSGGLPESGARVSCILDWDRRYALMRTHTALHILCGVVWRDYGASVTGGNMEPLRGRMDFEFETMRQELVAEIEEKINREVAARRPIRTQILPREEAFQIPDLIRTKINLLPEGILEVRTVELEGLDLQADGGTHVAETGEVGRICVAGYKSKGKANKRIEIELDPA
jgi:misacylated tRNA(Ala) deacylase